MSGPLEPQGQMDQSLALSAASSLKEGELARATVAESAKRLQQIIESMYQAEKTNKRLPEALTPQDKQKALFEAHKISQDQDGVLHVPAAADQNETAQNVYLAVAAMAAEGSPVIEASGGKPEQIRALLKATLANNVAVSKPALDRMVSKLRAHSETSDSLEILIQLSRINTELATTRPKLTGEERRTAIIEAAKERGIGDPSKFLELIDKVPGISLPSSSGPAVVRPADLPPAQPEQPAPLSVSVNPDPAHGLNVSEPEPGDPSAGVTVSISPPRPAESVVSSSGRVDPGGVSGAGEPGVQQRQGDKKKEASEVLPDAGADAVGPNPPWGALIAAARKSSEVVPVTSAVPPVKAGKIEVDDPGASRDGPSFG